MFRWSHHLNLWVQDNFDSGALGNFYFCKPHIMKQNSPSLRQALRQARRALTPSQQALASTRIFHRLSSTLEFRRAKRIAFYIAGDGEIDPTLLLATALERGQHCFLPCIHPFIRNRMLFVRYRTGDALVRHPWGMWQPVLRSQSILSPRALDLVFVPLVGFDSECNRLGMGKGFYDRGFAFRARSDRHRPQLIGLAHECQRVERLEHKPWDVRMNKIVSDYQTYRP